MSTQGETMTIDEAINKHRHAAYYYERNPHEMGAWSPDLIESAKLIADEIDRLRLELAEARKAAVPWRDGGARGAAWPWGGDTVSPRLVFISRTHTVLRATRVTRDEWDYISSYMVEADVLQAVRAGRE